MPLALVEGMAAGCACVVSDVIGAREVITPHVTGLKVPENDVEAMTAALLNLLTTPEQAKNLGKSARARACNTYGREHMWSTYHSLLLKRSISH